MKWLPQRDPRVKDELRYHRDRLIDDYMAAGMDRRSAERRAFLEFGNLAGLEESVRDARGRILADLLQDLRYACRTLRRSPGFAAIAILSLALGTGANAAVFGLINGVMLQALPVSRPDRLVVLARMRGDVPSSISYPLFELLRREVTSLSGGFVRGQSEPTIVIDGEDDLVSVDSVSGEFFSVLGVDAAAGRLLEPADDSISAPPAAVITDRYWQRRFARSPSAIGKAFTLGDRAFTIVGVTPPAFHGIRPDRVVDLFVPLDFTMGLQQRTSADYNALLMMGRLKPTATVAQADAEVQTLYAAFVHSQAANAPERGRPGILRQRAAVLPAADGVNDFRYQYSRSLLVLMGIVALVLLLACINLSGMLLARATGRQREISLRLAIGASRGRLVRQFLAESLVPVVIGTILGLTWAGWFSVTLFRLFIGEREMPPLSVGVDWRVVGFAAAAALVASALVGMAPAWRAARVTVNAGLKEVRARTARRCGWTLVVLQLGISMVLVVGATLFVGTLVKLNAVDRGFDPARVLVASVRSAAAYPEWQVRAVEAAVIDHLKALPGVDAVSAAQMLPLTGGLWDRSVQIDGYRFAANEPDTVGFNVIAPGYFATLSTPLVAGRDFDRRDTRTSPKVAIVNNRFARQFFGGPSAALGKRVTTAGVAYEIVGVVGDARYRGLRDAVLRTMYTVWTQRDGDQPRAYSYLLRLDGNARDLSPVLDRAIREADPGLRLRRVNGYASMVADSIATERILAALGGVFGILALVVAALGIFGVLALQVAQRTNELGVRMALGAGRSAMLALVLRDVGLMIVAGVSLGGVAAFAAGGVVRNLLFGLTPTDPAAFALAAGALSAVALLAGWLPAYRASRVDPLVALRHE